MNNKCEHFFCSKYSYQNRMTSYANAAWNNKSLNVCRDHLAPVKELCAKYGYSLTVTVI